MARPNSVNGGPAADRELRHGKRGWRAFRFRIGHAGPGRKKRRAGQGGIRYLRDRSAAGRQRETRAIGARTGAKEVGELALGFAERNIASSFEFAQKLLAAKEPKDVMSLHADYVSAQIANLNDQAKELTRRMAKVSG